MEEPCACFPVGSIPAQGRASAMPTTNAVAICVERALLAAFDAPLIENHIKTKKLLVHSLSLIHI